MATYNAFVKFQNFEPMNYSGMELAKDYIAGNLNSLGVNYRYYYDMYSYAVKCFIVLQKYDETRLGEAICNGELVNFLKDEKHKKCSCSSVYFNAVF